MTGICEGVRYAFWKQGSGQKKAGAGAGKRQGEVAMLAKALLGSENRVCTCIRRKTDTLGRACPLLSEGGEEMMSKAITTLNSF